VGILVAKVLLRSIRSGKRQSKISDLNSIVRKEIEQTIDNQVKPRLIKRHVDVVSNWKSDIGFGSKKFISSDKIEISIFPTGADKDVWNYVDQGTSSHPISGRPNLVFQWGGPGSYKPKTVPKAKVVSGGGVTVNARTIVAQSVNHPGSEAREFTKTFAEEEKPQFRRDMENAFRRSVDKVKE
jgi:hypothetical protein